MKHDWNWWDNYLSIHEQQLRFYSNFMTTVKTYNLKCHTERYYELSCEQIPFKTYKGSNIRVDIRKDILVRHYRGRLQARTYAYTYNSNLPNPDGRNLIRYCSPHMGHNQFHHKHDYTVDPPVIIQISDDSYPHVGEFINEVLETF